MTINALTNYSENELLDLLMGTNAFTMPSGTFLKWHTGDPGEDALNNAAAHTTRTEITAWDVAASLATENTNELVIASLAADETLSWWSVWDAVSAGNPLFYGELTTPRAVQIGDTITFAAGAIDLDFTGTNLSTYAGNGLLDHITGTSAFTGPTNTYVQMHTGAPGLAGTANVANLSTRTIAGAWSVAAAGATDNDALIAFTGTASETLSHLSIFDALTTGNCLWQGALTASKAVLASEDIEFAAGALDLSLL